MSELYNDPSWNREARHVAEKLDRNDPLGAQESMRRDLWQLQNDPHAQHQFLNMVNRQEHKGYGADLNIFRGPNGQEQWQITPPNYDARYPVPIPPPEMIPPEVIVPVPVPVPVQPSPGEALVNGLATGAGVGIGLGIMNKIFDGGHHHRR